MLLILDGWGYRQPVTPDNAIENGHTPNWHSYLKEYPHSLIETYGLALSMPMQTSVCTFSRAKSLSGP